MLNTNDQIEIQKILFLNIKESKTPNLLGISKLPTMAEKRWKERLKQKLLT